MMKPQVMSEPEFFVKLCHTLGIDPKFSDEDSVLRAIDALKQELESADMALEINQAQLISLEIEIDRLESEQD